MLTLKGKKAGVLVALRQRAGLDQKTLAQLIDVTPAAICGLEKERKRPSLDLAVKVINCLTEHGAEPTRDERASLIRKWSGGWVELFEESNAVEGEE